LFVYVLLFNERVEAKQRLQFWKLLSEVSGMEGIPTLLDWCQRNGIKIDGRLKIGRSPHGGIGVFNGGETQIDAPASGALEQHCPYVVADSSSGSNSQVRRVVGEIMFAVGLDHACALWTWRTPCTLPGGIR